MIEDESDVFEITDFTTASEWERFIARIEEIIHDWKLTTPNKCTPLTKDELSTGKWQEKSETLAFADFNFSLSHHSLKKENEPLCGDEANAQKEEEGSPTRDHSRQDSPEDDEDDELMPSSWQDMMSHDNDFPARAHCLCRWYSLGDFVILSPSVGMDDISSESRANILLSSVSIALHNTGCTVPLFVQVQQRWRRLYRGVCICSGFKSAFEMVHLKTIPHQYSHLSGLLDVFKAKLACSILPLPPVSVAVRFTYQLHDWTHYSWPQQPPDMDSLTADEVGVTEFGELPFGACEDPVSELQLSTTWPSLAEDMIVDNDVYSDLDPLQAPHWNVRVLVAEQPQCLLGDYMGEFVELCRRRESTDQLLGKSLMSSDDNMEVDASGALQRLTEPVPYVLPSLGTVVTRATSKLQIKPEEAPIPAGLLNEILLFLFPDAKAESGAASKATTPAATPLSETGPLDSDWLFTGAGITPSESQSDINSQFKELFKQFKSAPSESLTYRLAVCLCIINHSYGGLRAVAHLWQEFVLEMRYRWENNYVISDLGEGIPNTGCSLIHQKLQMLNCCIERKCNRESQQAKSAESGTDEMDSVQGRSDSKLDSSDEEFFECMESENDMNSSQSSQQLRKKRSSSTASKSGSKTSSKGDKDTSSKGDKDTSEEISKNSGSHSEGTDSGSFTDAVTHEPEGRLKPCGELILLNSDERLYVPMTQDPSPMTEDMLEEHAEVLAQLGTSPEGATLRARMQSACLLSDMESFKGANPGCILGDFVRWYSPRDWLEEEEMHEDGSITKKSQLSARMQIPGNMWVEVWQSARPVPARRQRRLFDDTKEAEKVLHWLSSMRPAEVALHLMPMLLHAAICKLMEQEVAQLPMLKKLFNQISNKTTKAMRATRMEVKRFEGLVSAIVNAEVMVTRAQSLLTKFNQEKQDLDLSTRELQGFVSDLLDQPEVNIVGAARAPLGSIIHRLFATAQKSSYLLPEETAEEEEGDKSSSSSSPNVPDFPSPIGREYILRCHVRRPSPWSRPSPQRMYAVLSHETFQLAGAFSADTTFQ